MIDEQVIEATKAFQDFWNEIFSEHKRFRLDGAWPSIGVIDRILLPLRGREKLDAEELVLIRGAAAYIGIFAYSYWSMFPDTEVELTASLDAKLEFILRASGGKHLGSGESFVVPLCRSLEKILKEGPGEKVLFAKFSRYVGPEDNIVSLFAAG